LLLVYTYVEMSSITIWSDALMHILQCY